MSTPFIPIKPADILWRNGIPFAREYDDIYFSTENGLDESNHVFLAGNDLIQRWQRLSSCSHFVIAETGFGTGLNFLLTWFEWLKYAPSNARLHYFACEKHPLSKQDLTQCLALWPKLSAQANELLDAYPMLTPGFHSLSFNNGRVKLTLMLGDAFHCYDQLLLTRDVSLESLLMPKKIDAWFLDGFAPNKNPSMWGDGLLQTISLLSGQTTTLATFTAAGDVQRQLKAVGFKLEKKAGYGRKREMITAQFSGPACSFPKRLTPWAFSESKKPETKRAVVLGAGLAGCFIARSLAERGWNITLIDEYSNPAQGASGNQQAVLFPTISAYCAPLTDFMLMSFQYAARFYKNILAQHAIGELNGILQLVSDDNEINDKNLADWLDHYPELAGYLDIKAASKKARITMSAPGLFIPQAGWIDSQKLCKHLIDHHNIYWQGGLKIESIYRESGEWIIGDYQTETLIISNGYKANQFSETRYLPIKAIRGQLTSMPETNDSADLAIPLCGQGHVLPSQAGSHTLGATYHFNDDNYCPIEDDQLNLSRIEAMPTPISWSLNSTSNWTRMRATSPDHIPMVGVVAKKQAFVQHFSGLSSNSKRWIPQPAPCYPGLFVLTGFGSKGLTTIPLCAEWLAGYINQEPSILPRKLVQAISPSRFVTRDIIKKRLK